jgi:hypothetical protein
VTNLTLYRLKHECGYGYGELIEHHMVCINNYSKTILNNTIFFHRITSQLLVGVMLRILNPERNKPGQEVIIQCNGLPFTNFKQLITCRYRMFVTGA